MKKTAREQLDNELKTVSRDMGCVQFSRRGGIELGENLWEMRRKFLSWEETESFFFLCLTVELGKYTSRCWYFLFALGFEQV